tara:strand:+ start:506 stop:634 length:129 start_codon:yes stop_codon:yes gene_type:complete
MTNQGIELLAKLIILFAFVAFLQFLVEIRERLVKESKENGRK